VTRLEHLKISQQMSLDLKIKIWTLINVLIYKKLKDKLFNFVIELCFVCSLIYITKTSPFWEQNNFD